ncbi:hypothetical protein JHK82_022601 [Glycine max]|nr:hypothetical protein JHK82_022601 [Glycine max]
MDKLKKRLPGDRTNLVDLGRNYRSDQFAFVNYTVIYKTKVERKDIELVDEEEAQIGVDRSSATSNKSEIYKEEARNAAQKHKPKRVESVNADAEAFALEHMRKRDAGHQSVSLENKTGDSTVLKIGDSAKVVIKQDVLSGFFFFFEDEGESPVESDETKVQTWSSQHYRNEPVVVVAAPRLQKYSSFDDQSGEKPLLLPIQSFKSRLSKEVIDVQSQNMSMSSKRFSSYSNRKAEVKAVDVDVDVQYLNRSTTFKRSTISQGFSSNSNRKAEVIMLSSNTYVIMLSSNAEDSVRKKGFYKSCPPPPLPPPPTMFQKSVFMKPRFDGSSNEAPSFNKELKRSFTTEKESLLVESDDDDDDDDTETEDQDVEGGRTVAQNNDRGKGPPVIGGES